MTLEMAVAPIALALANHPRLEEYDLSSLRYIMWGATPVTRSVAERVTERTGVRWLCGYGASEVPVIAVNPIGDPSAWRLDSAGLPPQGVELQVADLDSGRTLAAGEVGEIQVRSGSVMAGYLPDEANSDAFAEGWYRTGDVGWLEPEGWVHLTDRSKEMIKVKGFQVAPAEIEAVLHGHPGVRDCAVFAVPDESAGRCPSRPLRWSPVRRSHPRSCSAWSLTRSRDTSVCARFSSSRRFRGCRRARCCDARCAMSGRLGWLPRRRSGALTDGRQAVCRAAGPAGVCGGPGEPVTRHVRTRAGRP